MNGWAEDERLIRGFIRRHTPAEEGVSSASSKSERRGRSEQREEPAERDVSPASQMHPMSGVSIPLTTEQRRAALRRGKKINRHLKTETGGNKKKSLKLRRKRRKNKTIKVAK